MAIAVKPIFFSKGGGRRAGRIPHDILNELPSHIITTTLLNLIDATEGAERSITGFLRIHSIRYVLFDAKIEMKSHLLTHLLL